MKKIEKRALPIFISKLKGNNTQHSGHTILFKLKKTNKYN